MRIIFVFLSLLFQCNIYAFHRDTIDKTIPHFKFEQIIIPSLMVSYGYISIASKNVRSFDYKINEATQGFRHYSIDDYLLYTPLVVDLGLTLSGYKSKHNYPQKLGRYLISTVINGLMVYPVKLLTVRERPDLSDQKSFPSGHTSNAFVGAEFFWQEYNHKSKWLASSGYLIAATTGYLRMYNNKHWFSDVVAGAGIGILSTKITYWLLPKIMSKINRPKSSENPKTYIY